MHAPPRDAAIRIPVFDLAAPERYSTVGGPASDGYLLIFSLEIIATGMIQNSW